MNSAGRSKVRRLLLVAALVVGAAAALYFFALRQQPGGLEDVALSDTEVQSEAEAEAIDAPSPIHYDFEWREGDVRGVDVPTRVRNPKTGKVVPIHLVQDIVSLEGEGKIDFLHRVREVMVAYSDKHTHEACGEICTNGSTHSIRITTNAAVTRCAVAPICMQGHETTLASIHSHCPSRGQLKATLADEYLGVGDIRKGMNLARCDTERFSAMDLAGRRPGWLAGRRALHEHDGPARIARYEIDVEVEQSADQRSLNAN